jgi:hypothetical protein
MEISHGVATKARPNVEHNPDSGGTFNGGHPAQQDRGVWVAGKGKRFSTFDYRAGADPAAVPNERTFLVRATPDETRFLRRNGVHAFPSDQIRKDGIRVPSGNAHPRTFSPRANDDTPLAVGQEGIFAENLRSEFFGMRSEWF